MRVTSQVGKDQIISRLLWWCRCAVRYSNMYCSVYGCTSDSKCNPDGNLHFFKFPEAENGIKERRRRKYWIDFCKRKAFVPSINSRICSKHFEPNAFDPCRSSHFLKSIDFPGKFKPILKDGALPTTAIFNESEVLSAVKRPTGVITRKKVRYSFFKGNQIPNIK